MNERTRHKAVQSVALWLYVGAALSKGFTSAGQHAHVDNANMLLFAGVTFNILAEVIILHKIYFFRPFTCQANDLSRLFQWD